MDLRFILFLGEEETALQDGDQLQVIESHETVGFFRNGDPLYRIDELGRLDNKFNADVYVVIGLLTHLGINLEPIINDGDKRIYSLSQRPPQVQGKGKRKAS